MRRDLTEQNALKATITKLKLESEAKIDKLKRECDRITRQYRMMQGDNEQLKDQLSQLEKDRLENWNDVAKCDACSMS